MNTNKLKTSILLLSFCTMAWMYPTASLATDITVNANQSQILNVDGGISRIAIANPNIADITVTSGQQLLVVAKTVGSTSLYVWDGNGGCHDYTVVVTAQDVAAGDAIQHIIGYPGLKVDKIGGKILLSGYVRDQEQQQRADAIAKMYSSDVVDMLTMTNPMQINIEARIVEISKNKTKNLGVNWGNASSIDGTTGIATVNSGSFSFGQYNKYDSYGGGTTTSSDGSSTTSAANSYKYSTAGPLMATLNLLIGHGDAKVLSQPHVVTMSGQKASILIGGEMPVPSTNSNGSTNVEWKNYGIELNMEPVADESGLITSKVMVSVSTLSSAAGIIVNGTSLKGLATRKAETVIGLPSGQTMVIGGLLSTEDTKTINKIPLLGDIPILGRLFRDVSDSHDEKELLIFITPTLVDSSTSTKVSDDMKHDLHDITRDQQQMYAIPDVREGNTVIAKDEYQEEDEALAAKKAEEKAKADKKTAEERQKRLADEAKSQEKTQTQSQPQMQIQTDTGASSVVPVPLDTYVGSSNT